jgi:hypothetical protein
VCSAEGTARLKLKFLSMHALPMHSIYEIMKWSRDHVLMWCFIYVDFTDLLTVIEFTKR